MALLAAVTLIIAAVAPVVAQAQSRARRELVISPTGAGPIRVGMSLSQASRVAGNRLIETQPDADAVPACRYYIARTHDLRGVAFLVRNDQVVRLTTDYFDPTDTRNRQFVGRARTAEGLRVGDRDARVRLLYPAATLISNSLYDERGYIVRQGSGGYLILMDGSSRRVVEIRAGLSASLSSDIEGCPMSPYVESGLG